MERIGQGLRGRDRLRIAIERDQPSRRAQLRQNGATVPTPTEGAVEVATVGSRRKRRQRLGQHDRLVTVRGNPVYGLR